MKCLGSSPDRHPPPAQSSPRRPAPVGTPAHVYIVNTLGPNIRQVYVYRIHIRGLIHRIRLVHVYIWCLIAVHNPLDPLLGVQRQPVRLLTYMTSIYSCQTRGVRIQCSYTRVETLYTVGTRIYGVWAAVRIAVHHLLNRVGKKNQFDNLLAMKFTTRMLCH